MLPTTPESSRSTGAHQPAGIILQPASDFGLFGYHANW